MNTITKLLVNEKQFYQIQEALATAHMNDRIIERLYDLDLPQDIINKTNDKLRTIKQTDFPIDKSYAIRLSQFQPILTAETKDIFTKINGRPYYKHKDSQGRTSIGDELWAIVRDNKIVTFLMRKSEETEKGTDFLKTLLNVNFVEI